VRSALLRHVDDGSALAASFPLAEVRLHLPVQIADYTDFYSSSAQRYCVRRNSTLPLGMPMTWA
jgi:hypothetical protein